MEPGLQDDLECLKYVRKKPTPFASAFNDSPQYNSCTVLILLSHLRFQNNPGRRGGTRKHGAEKEEEKASRGSGGGVRGHTGERPPGSPKAGALLPRPSPGALLSGPHFHSALFSPLVLLPPTHNTPSSG